MIDYGYCYIFFDIIFLMVFMVFILVINGCVVLLGCFFNMRFISNILLVSLVVFDFFVGFVGILFLVVCSVIYEILLCLSFNIFFKFILLLIVLYIIIIICDCYLYIMWVLCYCDIV